MSSEGGGQVSSIPCDSQAGRDQLVEFLASRVKTVGRALDVGCSQGAMGARLKRCGYGEVVGVEPVPEAAKVAATRLDRVIVGVFPHDELAEIGKFDLIVFADSLEHMPDPWNALRVAYGLCLPGGNLLVSAPNVSHWTIVQSILMNRWDYADYGLLDRTHVRFFTPATLREAVVEAGFTIVAQSSPHALSGWRRSLRPKFTDRHWPHLLVAQSYVVARRENQ